MSLSTVETLRAGVRVALVNQGYRIQENGSFALSYYGRKGRRRAHYVAKCERLASCAHFIRSNIELVRPSMLEGDAVEVGKITPTLIEVVPGSVEETLFRWWNLVWWSLPYEHPYGRQMRFLVWDEYHQAVIGLIGLQSPILRWNVRDHYLGITTDTRDYWVNQSLSAQRLGAVPPYNQILGGKLVALLMTSDNVAKRFTRKYRGKTTLMQERSLPARLLFITTTGAYGKSSVYQRLSFNGERVARFIGYSQGSGSFHIPNDLFLDLLRYLEQRGFDTRRGFGSGPSTKLRLIDRALRLLGFPSGAEHGIQRAVYLFPLVKNLTDVIRDDARPLWYHRRIQDLTHFWMERWAMPRTERDNTFRTYSVSRFIASVKRNLTIALRSCQTE